MRSRMIGTSLAVLATVFSAAFVGTALSACGEDGGDPVLRGVNAIVFAKRKFVREDGSHDSGGTGQVLDYLRYVPGGGIFVMEPPTPGGELRSLTAEFPEADISGLDVSYDATQVVFSMKRNGGDRYHIYVANLQGAPEVRQLTFGEYDDVSPVFLAGDEIAFVTNQPYTEMGTRADEYNHSRQVSQMAVINRFDGDANRRLCSQNLSNTVSPFPMSDGTVGFSRWEHLGPVNDAKLFHMNPDCSGMLAVAGQFNMPFNSITQARETSPGRFVGIASPRSKTIMAGSLVAVDARSATRADHIDVQDAQFEVLTPDVPTGAGASPTGRYRTPSALPDGRLLVSWANGGVNAGEVGQSETAPNFGLYIFDSASRQRVLLHDDPTTWELYGLAVQPRNEPAVRTPAVDGSYRPGTPATIGGIDIADTSLDETVRGAQFGEGVPLDQALRQAERVRIIEGFSGEIGIGMFGLTMHEGAAVVGEARVHADGSWEANIPPYIPVHLQPLDRFGMSIRNQMLWIQAMPGENRRCGGCHESRSETTRPRMGATTLAQQAGPENFNIAIAERQELPWMGAASGNIQDLFNRACVSCHSGGAGDPFAGRTYRITVPAEELDGATEDLVVDIPWLDLSDRPLTVPYEMDVVTYPASYVTLLFPGGMMGEVEVEGEMPPEWVVVGSARESALIRGINIEAEDDATVRAWADRPMHPEDVGGTLSREDRMMLIRMADLGGQYWSRRNVEGSAYWEEYREPGL